MNVRELGGRSKELSMVGGTVERWFMEGSVSTLSSSWKWTTPHHTTLLWLHSQEVSLLCPHIPPTDV